MCSSFGSSGEAIAGEAHSAPPDSLAGFKPVLVNLFRNRTYSQLLLRSLYTPVFTTQYTEIVSMLMEKNKTAVKENIYLYQ